MRRLREDTGPLDPTVSAALGRIGEPALAPLLAALQDERAPVHARAANALMFFKDQRVMGPLTAALHDSDAAVRREAQSALQLIRTARMLARVERLKREG